MLKLNLSTQLLQIHDFPDKAGGTCVNNARLTSRLTHQQGSLPFTAHKLFCWHKGHWLVSMAGISTIALD
nr:hypothetical protein [Colwellia sp. MB02u-10]